jgi:O-antigen/teichoic acid export membrane protein
MTLTKTGLKERILHGGIWTTGGFVAAQVLRLVGNLLLTRMLVPEAFGLMSIVYVLMVGLQLFSDLGISQSIVGNKNAEDINFLNTAWSLQILRGGLLWVLSMLLASVIPVLSNFGLLSSKSVYLDPQLPWLIGVFSFSAVILGFESVKVALAGRYIQLAKLTKIELLSQTLSLIVTISIAWFYHTVWALVVGALLATLLRVIFGHYYLPGPSCKFFIDKNYLWELIHFGKWISFLSIIGFLSMNGDRIILGGAITAEQLGIYAIAFMLSNMIYSVFTSVLAKVVFPAFSEVLRDRPLDIGKIYQKFQIIADVVLFSTAGFLSQAATGIVDILYDNRYHSAGHILSLLSLGLIGCRYLVVDQYCLASKSMWYMTAYRISGMVSLFTLASLGLFLNGFEGALIGIVVSQFASWPIAINFKIKHLHSKFIFELIGIPVFGIAAIIGLGFNGLLTH